MANENIRHIDIGEGLELELPKRLLTEDVQNFRVFKWDARKIVREGRVFHPAENDYLVSSIYDISNQAFRFPDGEEEKIWVKVKLDEGKAEENRVYKAVVIADKQPTYKKAWLKLGYVCFSTTAIDTCCILSYPQKTEFTCGPTGGIYTASNDYRIQMFVPEMVLTHEELMMVETKDPNTEYLTYKLAEKPAIQPISNMTPSLAVDRFNPKNILKPFKIRLPKPNTAGRSGDKMVVIWWLDDEPHIFDPEKGDIVVEDNEDNVMITVNKFKMKQSTMKPEHAGLDFVPGTTPRKTIPVSKESSEKRKMGEQKAGMKFAKEGFQIAWIKPGINHREIRDDAKILMNIHHVCNILIFARKESNFKFAIRVECIPEYKISAMKQKRAHEHQFTEITDCRSKTVQIHEDERLRLNYVVKAEIQPQYTFVYKGSFDTNFALLAIDLPKGGRIGAFENMQFDLTSDKFVKIRIHQTNLPLLKLSKLKIPNKPVEEGDSEFFADSSLIVLSKHLTNKLHEVGQFGRELKIPTAVIIGLEEEFKVHTTGFLHRLLQFWLDMPETQEQSNMFTFLLAAIDKSMQSINTKWTTKIMTRVHKAGRALTDDDFKGKNVTEADKSGEFSAQASK
ncbi:uncharacterized protein LOC143076154 isoform X2 [Mytilus galloprovincialis]|uniref:uncharacterized protein LOC143076154 isoform X2 n=1 Tax=Mytilus galloprovincialis TaxID=29158 RepID=UPI003F7BF17F